MAPSTVETRLELGFKAPDYSRAPLLVYWELTQACDLACRHCRARSYRHPHPLELNSGEASRLLHQIAGFGQPYPRLVMTGGDPLRRPDLFELVDEAKGVGLEVAVTPSATPHLTAAMLARLKAHGVHDIALSLDGSTAGRHDALRGVSGCYDRTLRAARTAAVLGLRVQINTLVAAETLDDLPAIYQLLLTLKIACWSLFFLIPIGRGRLLQEVDPGRSEAIMVWIFESSSAVPFSVRTTEAPSYRRVALSRLQPEGGPGDHAGSASLARGFGVRDGHGILFVSHAGDVCPAGFLPLPAGNVRQDNLVELYRASPLFRQLRNPDRFKGRCGRCEYRAICGGSRARAFADTGDPLASDPLCTYTPGNSRPATAPMD